MGNVSAGSVPVASYAGPATPTCGDASNVIYATKNLNTSSTATFTWEAKDQNGTVLNSGTWDAVGGQCLLIKIAA